MSAQRRGSDCLQMDGSSDLRLPVLPPGRQSRERVIPRRFSAGPIPCASLLLPVLLLAAVIAAAQAPDAGASLSYTKVLKGSVPEYEQIVIHADGTGQYDGRKLSDPPAPKPFDLSPAVAAKLFDLAASLRDFQNVDLESHKRVADLGRKTLVYQKGGERYQCEFNYTLNRRAQELTNLFEGLAAVERHITALEYSMKYDPLGLPKDLTEIQMDLDQGALTAPGLMAPDLKKIIQDSRYLHIAQVRAQRILDRIQD